MNILAIGVIQGAKWRARWVTRSDIFLFAAILVARIWYLFQGSRRVQISVIFGFAISLILSLVFLYLSANDIRILDLAQAFPEIQSLRRGCKAARPEGFWRIYIPSLALHVGIHEEQLSES